jgi:hypothetical protein
MSVDADKLRNDLLNDLYGAFWAGGYGGASMEAHDIEKMSDEELVEYAEEKGVDTDKYQI